MPLKNGRLMLALIIILLALSAMLCVIILAQVLT